MGRGMNDILEWTATISGIVAAVMIALNIGRRVTGYGFIIFLVCSISWVLFGIMENDDGLAIQNVVLTAINFLGVYRYLIAKHAD